MISVCAGPKGTPNSAFTSGVPTTGAGPALATPSLALIWDAAAAASCAALLAPLHTHTHTQGYAYQWKNWKPNKNLCYRNMSVTDRLILTKFGTWCALALWTHSANKILGLKKFKMVASCHVKNWKKIYLKNVGTDFSRILMCWCIMALA